jgi:hypothetical protein
VTPVLFIAARPLELRVKSFHPDWLRLEKAIPVAKAVEPNCVQSASTKVPKFAGVNPTISMEVELGLLKFVVLP